MRTKASPAQRATKHLKRIAALVGAVRIRGGIYWLRVGRKDFLVENKFVRAISRQGKFTCFSVATAPDTPSAEVVACALLQLKSNPRLFKEWRRHPGYMFKANGKVFQPLENL